MVFHLFRCCLHATGQNRNLYFTTVIIITGIMVESALINVSFKWYINVYN